MAQGARGMPELAARWGARIVAAIAALLCAAPAHADPFKWPQPNGLGTPVVLTYSYSNLLRTDFDGIPVWKLKTATEEALRLWSSYAPLSFFQRPDAGPRPSDAWYDAAGVPDIRIGAHSGFDEFKLAHAYFPIMVESDGLAGDVHFSTDPAIAWSLGAGFPTIDFLEVMTHELGHTLGLPHLGPNTIMYTFHEYRFHGLGTGFLLPGDIRAIQALYGVGSGSVVPMPEPGSMLLVASGGLIWVAARRRRRHRRYDKRSPGAFRVQRLIARDRAPIRRQVAHPRNQTA
jgi:hypothetical protein